MYQAGWWPDPGRRHQLRYHDGNRWTEHVSDNGYTSTDSYGLPDAVTPDGPYLPPANPYNPPSMYRGAQPQGASTPPYFIPVPAPAQRTNGLAVASLVLGILAALSGIIPFLFFLAFVFGILALVFGLVSWSAATKGAPNKGMAIAGTVLSAVGITLGVVGVIIVNRVVDNFEESVSNIFGTADPSEYEVVLGTCGPGDNNWLSASGTIQNTTSGRTSFWVTVRFLDTNGVQVADASDIIGTLEPGRTANWQANSYEEYPGAVTCEIIVE
ncbi:MAG TPA: DUF2510 domain-containing protein [Ilumatobacteraceae bacterium]|nr:DUF2510 domain-containing protein [Ilumatobacteraceae bacterium]